MLKAIETKYKGFRFRSRLEARHAVFMDALNIRWEYEVQGFELDVGRYLPDFWLPDFKAFLEIKPDYENNEKLSTLVEEHGDCVGHLIYGGFGTLNPRIESVCTDLGSDSGGTGYFETTWEICANCSRAFIHFDTDNSLFLDTGFEKHYSPCPCGKPKPLFEWNDGVATTPWRLQHALIAARSARFEYGERGAR